MGSKTVLTYGTFDLFHVGHLNLLKRLSNLGDRLIVGISTDEFNDLKGKKAVYTFEERREILGSIRYVDKVIPESCWEQKLDDIARYEVDIFAMGDDWKGRFDSLSEFVDVVYLPRTPGVSTTAIRKDIARRVRHIDTSLSCSNQSVDILSA